MTQRSWRDAWHDLAQPSAPTMLLLGFGSGLPFLLVASTMALWLKDDGLSIDAITVLAGAVMLYSLKFFWAPLVDRVRLPWFGRLGLRRGWLAATQVGLIIGLVLMAVVTPQHLSVYVVLALWTAFSGATQDTVLAAYRIEIAPVEAQAGLAAAVILGYRLALMVSGGLALMVADVIGWRWVYVVMAAFMLIPLVTTLVMREPDVVHVQQTGWLARMVEGVVNPFVEFFKRYKWQVGLGLLGFLLLFKISDQALSGGLMTPFYQAAGFSKSQIGTVSGLYGVWIGIAGAFLGGIAVARFGLRASLWAGMILGAVSNLLYVFLAYHNGAVWAYVLTITGENMSGGFLGTVAVAYLSALVSRQYTATQYALFDSFVTLPGKVLGMASGSLVLWFSGTATATMHGYAIYFAFTTVIVVPALILFAWLGPRASVHERADDAPASAS